MEIGAANLLKLLEWLALQVLHPQSNTFALPVLQARPAATWYTHLQQASRFCLQ